MNIEKRVCKTIKSLVGKKFDSIHIHEPSFAGSNAMDYLKECIESGWVSSSGIWVKKFEDLISSYTGAKYSIAVSNGTSALRLSLHLIGVKAKEEVLIPPLSFVATANAISHLGAEPHFIDIEPLTLGMCPLALEKRLNKVGEKRKNQVFNKLTGKRISAVMPVHVFGLPAKINEIKKICSEWDLPLVEDAAEALGSSIIIPERKIHCGCIGDIGILSFNGNKIITTGGGGAILTNNLEIAKKAKHLSTTAKLDHPWEYFHDQIGWNDRLPNINAAIGVSQIENLKTKLHYKRLLHKKYVDIFSDLSEIEIINEGENCKSNYWLNTLRLNVDKPEILRERILLEAHNAKIYLRPSWKLLNQLPMYTKCQRDELNEAFYQSKRLINLPSSPQLIS